MPSQRGTERFIETIRHEQFSQSIGKGLNPGAMVGVVSPEHGGSGVYGDTLGNTDLWINNGSAAEQGTVVVFVGDQLFDTSDVQGDDRVIGVLDDNGLGSGQHCRIRHGGYQRVVKVAGSVTAGNYLRVSVTAGTAEDCGPTPMPGAFARAITSGEGTCAAFLLGAVYV